MKLKFTKKINLFLHKAYLKIQHTSSKEVKKKDDQSCSYAHTLIERTFRFFMFLAIIIVSLVPLVFISTADFRGSFNLTVAAPWNTIETVSSKIWRSVADKPRPISAQSPVNGTIFRNVSGLSRLIESNNCGDKRVSVSLKE